MSMMLRAIATLAVFVCVSAMNAKAAAAYAALCA